jgi:hypothetical protein
VIYLPSSQTSKEDCARQVAKRDGIRKGAICLISCLEACKSFEVRPNRRTRRLHVHSELRRCLCFYRYALHPEFGFMHTRIQTWFPFTARVYVNGREWLAQQMDRRRLGYVRRDNCFVRLANAAHAQRLMDDQLRLGWSSVLDELVSELNPLYPSMFGRFVAPYYWSVDQSEWATDVLFRSSDALAHIYPRLVHHGIRSFSSADVMRFLGQRIPAHGHVHGHFRGEVVSDLRRRPEGIRIKHRLNTNSIKLYDKQGSVLRVETTIVHADQFKVFRRPEGTRRGQRAWRPLRQGIADLHRRTRVCQAANRRYLQALATVDENANLGQLTERLNHAPQLNGRRVRPLRPLAPDDLRLLQAVNHGEFVINGLRNRDLRHLLFPDPATTMDEQRRRSAHVGGLLRLLRAHRILRKVPRTHRYHLTDSGRRIITALLAANDASVRELIEKAA